MPLTFTAAVPGRYEAKLGQNLFTLSEPKEGKHQTLVMEVYLPILEQTFRTYLCIDPERIIKPWNKAAQTLDQLGIPYTELPLTEFKDEQGFSRFREDKKDALLKVSKRVADALAPRTIMVRLGLQGGDGPFRDNLELKGYKHDFDTVPHFAPEGGEE